MGWVQGLEPWTSGTTTRRSSQLGYTHRVSCAKALDYYYKNHPKMQAKFLTNLKKVRVALIQPFHRRETHQEDARREANRLRIQRMSV